MRYVSWRSCLSLFICLIMASTALAQNEGRRGGRGGGFGGFGGGGFGFGRGGGMGMPPLMLLNAEPVQKELKLTDEQKEKVTEMQEESMAAMREGFGGRGGFRNPQELSDEERQKMREEGRKRMEEMRKRQDEQNKKIEALLNAEQNKRLKQIGLWMQGNGALANDDIAKELNLSDEQKESVKTISDEVGNQSGEIFREHQGDFEKIQEGTAKVRKDADEEYMAVLTDPQKAKYEQLRGPKFEMEMSQLFGGGRGGFSGFGGRRGGRGRGGNSDDN